MGREDVDKIFAILEKIRESSLSVDDKVEIFERLATIETKVSSIKEKIDETRCAAHGDSINGLKVDIERAHTKMEKMKFVLLTSVFSAVAALLSGMIAVAKVTWK